jgi:hypothetical protein
MEIFPDGILSRAKPAACAASLVDFVERDYVKIRLFRCLLRRFIWSCRTVLKCDRYSAHRDEPSSTPNLFMITCQGTAQVR